MGSFVLAIPAADRARARAYLGGGSLSESDFDDQLTASDQRRGGDPRTGRFKMDLGSCRDVVGDMERWYQRKCMQVIIMSTRVQEMRALI